MICIFSTCVDYSTTEVIRWLSYFGKKDVLRINSDEANSIKINIINRDLCFEINDRVIHLSDVEAVWYRKGRNWLCNQFYPIDDRDKFRFTTYLKNKLQLEEANLSEYLHFIIENTIPSLGSAKKGNLNKLLVLDAAQEVGFIIPHFYISNYQEGIKQIFEQSPDLITKSISDGIYLFDQTESKTGYFSYTEKLDKSIVEELPDLISPSLLQENIRKKFDLRVFVLNDKCYSMAILSQSDKQTQIDFRKYNEKKPNRNIPYILPKEIELKIQQLFNKLGLKTGSVDFIVDREDRFYFLEINPVGQYDVVSRTCNYFLDKQIALTLMKNAG